MSTSNFYWVVASVADPDPEFGAFLTLDPGSGMNIPDPIFENLVSVFGVKNTYFFDADPDSGSCQPPPPPMDLGSGMEKIGF